MNQVQMVFESPLGWIGFAGTLRGMIALTFGHESAGEAETALVRLIPAGAAREMSTKDGDFDWLLPARELLLAYAAGEPVDLGKIPVDLPRATPFQQRVRDCLRQLPRGETISYQQLASRAGQPNAARAVGNIMAKNPLPLVIPCHRVLGSGGRLGGFSAPQGLAMKKRLLRMEQDAIAAAVVR